MAAWLRFFRLTARSLWLDEIFTSKAAHLSSATDVVAFAKADVDQMPLFYLVTWLLRVWGDGAFVLRVQSVVAGTLAVLALYLLANKFFGMRVAIVASLLMAVMPYAVWYSQEARNYALLMLLTTLQMYFTYTAVDRGRWFDWAGLAALTILNLYTHYLALEATAAAVAFVALFLLRELIGRASRRVRVAVGLVVAAGVIAGLFVPWRPILRSAYGLLSASAMLASHHKALAAMAGLILLGVLTALLVYRYRAIESAIGRPAMARTAAAVGCGTAVVIAYLPWLPDLHTFLATPTKGFGRLDLGQKPDLGAIAGMATAIGFSGFILVFLGVGGVALAILALRDRSRPAVLMLCWLAVPLALLLLSVRWAVVQLDIRYFAFLFPAAVVATAVGVDAFYRAAKRALGGLEPRLNVRLAAIATMGATALVLAQAATGLAVSYQAPKNDWRTTAAFIQAASPQPTVVLAVGNYSDWSTLSLQYYFSEMHMDATVVDGRQVTSDTVHLLDSPNASVLGVIDYPSDSQQRLIDQGSSVRPIFVDVTRTIHLVQIAGASAHDQAQELLRWELPLQPELRPSLETLELASGASTVGANLAPGPPGAAWRVGPGAQIVTSTIELRPTANVEADAYFTAPPLEEGDDVLVTFDHQSASVTGSQQVYALAFDGRDHLIGSYPNGGTGFACTPAADWENSYFAFSVPKGTTSLVIMFRATGSGTAEFRDLQLARFMQGS